MTINNIILNTAILMVNYNENDNFQFIFYKYPLQSKNFQNKLLYFNM